MLRCRCLEAESPCQQYSLERKTFRRIAILRQPERVSIRVFTCHLWRAAELSPVSSTASHVPRREGQRTIWGRSRESFPMVLKTRSWSLLTMLRSSSPSDAITLVDVCGSSVPANFGLLQGKQQRPRWLRDRCNRCAEAKTWFRRCRDGLHRSGTWMSAGLGLSS